MRTGSLTATYKNGIWYCKHDCAYPNGAQPAAKSHQKKEDNDDESWEDEEDELNEENFVL